LGRRRLSNEAMVRDIRFEANESHLYDMTKRTENTDKIKLEHVSSLCFQTLSSRSVGGSYKYTQTDRQTRFQEAFLYHSGGCKRYKSVKIHISSFPPSQFFIVCNAGKAAHCYLASTPSQVEPASSNDSLRAETYSFMSYILAISVILAVKNRLTER
jgi:hypothetical protein